MRTFWDTEMYRGILMVFLAVLSIAAVLSGCSRAGSSSQAGAGNTGNLSSGSGAADTVPPDTAEDRLSDGEAAYTLETKVMDVINDPVFGGCGRLIFPADMSIDEELARAIAFLRENADELQIDMTDYSLWGGSAGARMAAWLGAYGTEAFGEDEYPYPAAVIMQYTGLSDVTGNEPPTYACVGTSDGIASYRSMENYISWIQADGTDAEIEVFDGLRHGFGLGEGTVAEGWIDHAVSFWERNMDD